jgi:hypothetical protein
VRDVIIVVVEVIYIMKPYKCFVFFGDFEGGMSRNLCLEAWTLL